MLKIIIVDDSDEKIHLIKSVIESDSLQDITVVKTSADAQEAFSHNVYDLAIIDLALPTRDDDKPTENAGLELIKSIHQFDWFKKPKNLIAITQHSNLEIKYTSDFKDIGVVVYYYDGTNHIDEKILYHLDVVKKSKNQVEYDYDVVIVGALDEEVQPIKLSSDFRWNNKTIFGIQDINIQTCIYEVGTKKNKLALVTLPRMGLVNSAITTSRITSFLKPKLVIMPGICAGVEGEVKIGDIIVASPCWEWQTGKWKGNDFSIEPYQIQVDQILINQLHKVNATNVLESIWSSTKCIRTPNIPELHVGAMVSGSSVVSNSDMMKSMIEQHRKLLGVEMEIFGVYAACVYSHVKPKFIGLKSVCDFGNEIKGDSHHSYCSEIAGKYTVEFVKSYLRDSIE